MALTSRDKIREARLRCPVPLWERWGFSCVRSGNEYRIKSSGGETLYRSYRDRGGVWRSVYKDCAAIGGDGPMDNISLCRKFERAFMNASGRKAYALDFPDVVDLVVRVCVGREAAPGPAASVEIEDVQDRGRSRAMFFRLMYPPMPGSVLAGRKYLAERGIPERVVFAFESRRLLNYLGSSAERQGAVVFCGWRGKEIAFAAKRLTGAPHEADPSSKYNIPGSDLRYPPVFMGEGPVIMVEGGVDMLSVASMFAMAGKPLPTAVMLAGRANMKIFENADFVDMAKKSAGLCFLLDNDRFANEDQRRHARAMIENFRARALESGLGGISLVLTPGGFKDANEFLTGAGPDEIRAFVDIFSGRARQAQRRPMR